MSRQEFSALQKNSNVVWIPTPLSESHDKLSTHQTDQTYYRSQAFTAHEGINPLLAAAYPLLTLAARLSTIEQYHDLTQLYQMLLHEIKVFEHQASQKEYRESSITIACYLLCSLLDETILQRTWGKSWEHCSLLATLHHDEPSKERVFHIIDRLLQHPSQHLDALELAYLCLSFGLKTPHQQDPSTEFLEKLDKIYHCIREERGEISHGFLVQTPTSLPNKKRKTQNSLPLSITLLISANALVIAYYVFCYSLKILTAPIAQQLSILNGN